jgi:SAM-dependent methyltransferase
MWAMGDYDRFATTLVWELGAMLVQACGVGPGQRLLDVAAGTGNTALRAAAAGAEVVASDLTPEHFDAGRRRARELGVTLEWREADAEALPFDDGAFDVVTSSVGAIFAPAQERAAAELLRVCRSGGTVGMVNFTPEGLGGEFFELFARHVPAPPPGARSPVEWGRESRVRELLGDGVSSLRMTRRHYVERAASPRAYRDFFLETFGPAVALRESLAAQPARLEAFEREFLDFARRRDRGRGTGGAEYPFEVLLVVARRA